MCQWVTGSASTAAVGDGNDCQVQSAREGSTSRIDLEEKVIDMKEGFLPPHEVKTGKVECLGEKSERWHPENQGHPAGRSSSLEGQM